MPELTLSFDADAAIDRLMRFLAVEGITGQEKAIAATVARALREVGVPAKAIRYDSAHATIPLPTQTGNLIVTLEGTQPGPRLLFSTHLDTVPLCAGAVPVRAGKKIVPAGTTALGGDNRTGCGVLVTLAATLLGQGLPHPPLTLLFTVREESGLFGAHYLRPRDLGPVAMGFNVDGGDPAEITVGAVGAQRWEAQISGKAAHAGAHPERGISATLVAALALAEVKQKGFFGKIVQDGKEGTSNVGSFGGHDGRSAGEATNVVTDYARITGEARSHDSRFVKTIVKVYRDAFMSAAAGVVDDRSRKAKVQFRTRQDYYPFRLAEDDAVVQYALAAGRRAGLKARTRIGNGGLDANWLVRHGIPTVTFGAGQNKIHTVEEFVDVDSYLAGCRMALALVAEAGRS
jgi:tripeptide aminopeptidase